MGQDGGEGDTEEAIGVEWILELELMVLLVGLTRGSGKRKSKMTSWFLCLSSWVNGCAIY